MSTGAPGPEDVTGVWDLQAFDVVDLETGPTTERPLGARPRGTLVYTADGCVSVNMMSSVEDGARHLGYAGRWRHEAGSLVHHIDVASRPDWIGAVQQREVEQDGDVLLVSTYGVREGVRERRRVTWRRRSGHHDGTPTSTGGRQP